ncbi:MAG TPA: undecaprenyl-diphosphate phosphatase [Candidatus Saccharimonadales bacterium]|nr:undecaprenyl-diphosphate phosphatase [Candidatus Saccharimonadales bacterium]
MITVIQAIILGLVQGITELFPISSLGHSVIIPNLLHWHINQNGQYFLTFLIATHLATAIVLFLFFLPEWIKIFKGLARSFLQRNIDSNDSYAKLGWLLVIGSIPAGILGLLFQQSLQKLFASAQIAAGLLIVNGLILLTAEKLRKRRKNARETSEKSADNIAKLGWWQSVGIGTIQSAALFPGISRSGSSMAGSLLAGLNNEDAAKFSFLLATPIIGAAALLKLPGLFNSSAAPIRGAMLAGAVAAAVAAYLSVKFLIKYFQTKTLTPFAIYCLIAGFSLSIYFWVK